MKPGYLSEIFVSFQGEGAYVGQRHLFVRLAGCNLRCTYCDTPESLERTAEFTVTRGERPTLRQRNPASAGEVIRLVGAVLEDEGAVDAIALTGGEPLTQSDFVATFLSAGHFDCPVLLETNGVLPHRLRDVLALVDIISMDLKLPSNTGEGVFWEEHAAFLALARTKDLYVKILIDRQTTDADLERACTLLASLAPNAPAFLQPIMSPTMQPLLESEQLRHLSTLARRHLAGVRVLPQMHKLLGIR